MDSPMKQLPEHVAEPVMSSRMAQHSNPQAGMAHLYIPSCLTSLRTSFEAPRDQALAKLNRRPRSTPRKARAPAADMDNDLFPPTNNYLMKGGSRVAEQKLHSMNRAAVKDLRTTNDMLASEFMRMRAAYEEERSRLRETNAHLEGDLRMMEEKLRQASDKLASEAAARAAQDAQHMTRLKEITKRLREEHNQRTAAQAELNQHKIMVATLGAQAADIGELRGEVARLEADKAGASATIADLRGRLAAAESKLETDAEVRNSLQSRLHASEASAASLSERASRLAASVAELEGQLATTRHALHEATQEGAYSKAALQQERDGHTALRQSAGALQADLTERHASSALAAAQAAADKSELERVRRELCDLRLTHDAAQEELARLREEALHTKSELAGYKATSTELGTECTALRHELRRVTEELTAQVSTLTDSKANEVAALTEANATQLAALRQSKDKEIASLKESCAAELASLRETTRLELATLRNQSETELDTLNRSTAAEIDQLKKQVSMYRYQAENHEQVFVENQSLTTRLQRTESALRQKESVLSEALVSHASQLEAWRAEATEVAQAASKWKQRALTLQQQVSALESSASQASGEVSALASRSTTLEEEQTKLTQTCSMLEGQLAACQHELVACKAQLKDSLAGQAAAARQADSTGHEAAQRAAAVDRLSARLAEETAKTTALRQDLASVTQQQVRELDAKSRMLSDLTAALAREERARDGAVREATSLRTHLATLERELRNAQAALLSISDDKLRSRSAYEAAEAALTSAQRQALQYKNDHKELTEGQHGHIHESIPERHESQQLDHQQQQQQLQQQQQQAAQQLPLDYYQPHSQLLDQQRNQMPIPPTTTNVPHAKQQQQPTAPAEAFGLDAGAYATLGLPGPSSPPPTPPSPRTSLSHVPRGSLEPPPSRGTILDFMLEEAAAAIAHERHPPTGHNHASVREQQAVARDGVLPRGQEGLQNFWSATQQQQQGVGDGVVEGQGFGQYSAWQGQQQTLGHHGLQGFGSPEAVARGPDARGGDGNSWPLAAGGPQGVPADADAFSFGHRKAMTRQLPQADIPRRYPMESHPIKEQPATMKLDSLFNSYLPGGSRHVPAPGGFSQLEHSSNLNTSAYGAPGVGGVSGSSAVQNPYAYHPAHHTTAEPVVPSAYGRAAYSQALAGVYAGPGGSRNAGFQQAYPGTPHPGTTQLQQQGQRQQAHMQQAHQQGHQHQRPAGLSSAALQAQPPAAPAGSQQGVRVARGTAGSEGSTGSTTLRKLQALLSAHDSP